MSNEYADFKFVPKHNGLLYRETKETFTIDGKTDRWFEFIDFYPSFINIQNKSFTNIVRAWSVRQKEGDNNVGFMVLLELGAIPIDQLKKMKLWTILPAELKAELKKIDGKGKILSDFASPALSEKKEKEDSNKEEFKQAPIVHKDMDEYGTLEEDPEDSNVAVIKKTEVELKPITEKKMDENVKPTDISVPIEPEPTVVPVIKPRRGRPPKAGIKELTCTKCNTLRYYGPRLIEKMAISNKVTVEQFASTWVCSTCVPRRKGRKPFLNTDPVLASIPKSVNCSICKKPVAIIPKQFKDKADRSKVTIEWLKSNYICRDCKRARDKNV